MEREDVSVTPEREGGSGGRGDRGNGCWRGRGDPTPFVPGLPDPVPSPRSLARLFDEMACCTRCDLARGRTQVVRGIGPRRASVFLLGEAPGAEEDRHGVPFVGRAGRLLDRLLSRAGVERRSVFITNVVACRPPGNRAPRAAEIRAHSPWLEHQLRLVRPRIVVTLGRIALGYFVPGAKVTEARGKPIRIDHAGRSLIILPTYHPAAALRSPDLLPALEADFGRLVDLLREARAT